MACKLHKDYPGATACPPERLLTREDILRIIGHTCEGEDGRMVMGNLCCFEAANKVSIYYERLIIQGKLRHVREVEWVKAETAPFYTCKGCGLHAFTEIPNYCPSCGNRVSTAPL